MSTRETAEDHVLEPNDSKRLASLCGPLNENLRQIEQRLGVEIRNRGNQFRLSGAPDCVETAGKMLHDLYRQTLQEGMLTGEQVHLALQDSNTQLVSEDSPDDIPVREDILRLPRCTVKAHGANQRRYIRRIQSHDINFGIGPAGTGKTWLAVASAVHALQQERVNRIVLVRPAVEAGEKLGFLPGDLSQKINPYLRPLYDALYTMLGFEQVTRLVDRNVIEVAPLAYMRGRTLDNAFIILDEGQNSTRDQMKMFLTRLGFSSIAVVTGDITQVDLGAGQSSGLTHAAHVLKDVEGISFTRFTPGDVVRHPLVQRIVEAYGRHEKGEGASDAS